MKFVPLAFSEIIACLLCDQGLVVAIPIMNNIDRSSSDVLLSSAHHKSDSSDPIDTGRPLINPDPYAKQPQSRQQKEALTKVNKNEHLMIEELVEAQISDMTGGLCSRISVKTIHCNHDAAAATTTTSAEVHDGNTVADDSVGKVVAKYKSVLTDAMVSEAKEKATALISNSVSDAIISELHS